MATCQWLLNDGWGLVSHSGILAGLILLQVLEGNNSYYEFMGSVVLLCPVLLDLWLYQFFHPHSHRSKYDTDDPYVAEHSRNTYALYFQHLWSSIHCTRKFTWGSLRAALFCEWRDAFSTIIVDLVGPTSSPAMGPWPSLQYQVVFPPVEQVLNPIRKQLVTPWHSCHYCIRRHTFPHQSLAHGVIFCFLVQAIDTVGTSVSCLSFY